MIEGLLGWVLTLLIIFGCYKLFGLWFFGFIAVFSAAIWFFGPGVWLIWLGVGVVGLFLVFWIIGTWRAESDRQDAYRYLAKKLRDEEGR